jgi:hypothetical protein
MNASRGAIAAIALAATAIGIGSVVSAQSSSPPVVAPGGGAWLAFAWFPDELYLVRSDGSDR